MMNSKLKTKQVTAQAPATLANLAMGFDLIGAAIQKPCDRVTLIKRDDKKLKIQNIISPHDLPYQVTKNTATIALRSVLNAQQDSQGFDVIIEKGIDCGSGMGGSAASSVAALVAYNGFLKKPLGKLELLKHAIKAESAVSGGLCVENPAAALWGGVVLCPDQHHVFPLTSPVGALLVVKPDIEVKTKDARNLLPKQVDLVDCTTRAGRCAAWVCALNNRDWAVAASMMQDDIIEPARASLWPHYQSIKKLGQRLGALAVTMSGSGPTVMLWVHRKDLASIQHKVERLCERQGYPVRCWSSSWRAPGAKTIGAH